MKRKDIRAKVWCIVLVTVMSFILCGCSGYTSSYKAMVLVQSNTKDSAFMSFSTFEGTIVFKLKAKTGAKLSYSAKLSEGSAKVYCDTDGTKKELFDVASGEEISAELDDLGSGTVYIIVETDGKCEEGDMHFDIV